MDREWPDRNQEWSQWDLHSYVRQMGINPDPHEIIPQGVKYIEWPPRKPTEAEITHVKELIKLLETEKIKPLAIILRLRDPRRN